MRPLLLFVLSLALAACIGESEPEPFTLRPTTSDPDSLLARLDVNELAEAFERLREAGYTAEVSVTDPDGTGAFEQTIEVRSDSTRVIEQSGPVSSESEPGFSVFDTVARLLPKEPPFRNPATREMYELTRGPQEGSVVRARAERREGTDPILHASVAVDTTTGQVVWADVFRESRSAVFDEMSAATVEMTKRNGTWWPSSGALRTVLAVPLSPSKVIHLQWRVLSIGGVELAADTSSTS